MPIKLCLQPGCGNTAHHRGRCPTHSRQHNTETHPNKGIYNTKRWQLLRRHILYTNPLCPCGAIATDADHIHPIQDGGDTWATHNLQALCQSCHSRKTQQELATR